jgi:undecaprenyl-diphosphatase
MAGLLLLATMVTALIGFGFKEQFEALFSSLLAVGFFLLLTGSVILIGERLGSGKKDLDRTSWLDALLIGLGQGAAIAPGLSRSGTTIAMALGRGLERDLAARFSFILSIPAILGAGLLQSKAIWKAGTIGVGFWPLFLGALAAFFSAFLAIRIFMVIIQRSSLKIFAYYALVLGLAIISFTLLGVL